MCTQQQKRHGLASSLGAAWYTEAFATGLYVSQRHDQYRKRCYVSGTTACDPLVSATSCSDTPSFNATTIYSDTPSSHATISHVSTSYFTATSFGASNSPHQLYTQKRIILLCPNTTKRKQLLRCCRNIDASLCTTSASECLQRNIRKLHSVSECNSTTWAIT